MLTHDRPDAVVSMAKILREFSEDNTVNAVRRFVTQ